MAGNDFASASSEAEGADRNLPHDNGFGNESGGGLVWFPIHAHYLPIGVKHIKLAGIMLAVEWRSELLKSYYGWEKEWPRNLDEAITAFIERWSELNSNHSIPECSCLRFSIEGAENLGDLRKLRFLKQAGLSCFQIYHFPWEGNDYFSTMNGVTADGQKLLKEMEELNLFLDLSHLSGSSLKKVCEHFQGRKILSHVVCEDILEWSVSHRPNSLSPAELEFCNADLYGVPFVDDIVSYTSAWTPQERKADVRTVARHILRLTEVVGAERVALGPDYFDEQILSSLLGFDVKTVDGLQTEAGLSHLKSELAALGLKGDQVEAIYHGNARRVFCE